MLLNQCSPHFISTLCSALLKRSFQYLQALDISVGKLQLNNVLQVQHPESALYKGSFTL